jgi:hypothetical protein
MAESLSLSPTSHLSEWNSLTSNPPDPKTEPWQCATQLLMPTIVYKIHCPSSQPEKNECRSWAVDGENDKAYTTWKDRPACRRAALWHDSRQGEAGGGV